MSQAHAHHHHHAHDAVTPVEAELPAFRAQDYARYDAESHAVWGLLYERRAEALEQTASRVFLDGMQRIGLDASRVPDLAEVNRRLDASTGWNAVGVDGFIPAAQFFRCLSRRRFPTATSPAFPNGPVRWPKSCTIGVSAARDRQSSSWTGSTNPTTRSR